MELSGTVLNVVDFGVFVDIGLSDSGLVHISRLADRFIRDPHEVVGVGDVLKVWVVDVDKARRRVSLTAIAAGQRAPAASAARTAAAAATAGLASRAAATSATAPATAARRTASQQQGSPTGRMRRALPKASGPPRRWRRWPPRPAPWWPARAQHPKTIDRPPTKPKKVKPLTKAMEEGKEPLRSFSDLLQLFDKKKQKPKEGRAAAARNAGDSNAVRLGIKSAAVANRCELPQSADCHAGAC